MKKIIILLSCIYFSILNISFSDNYEKIHIMYDTEIDNIIKDISLPLVKYSGVRGEVKLWMINDKNINAFTTFGRNIYLNTGLITNCNNPEMLAGVIAHELGHMRANHVYATKVQQKKSSFIAIASTIIGIATSIKNQEVGMTIATGGLNSAIQSTSIHSQEQEHMADNIAIEILEKNNISVTPLADLMKKFYRQEKIGITSSYELYGRTHPLSKDRINHLLKHNANLGKYNDSIQLRYKLSKAKILAYYNLSIGLESNELVKNYYNAYKNFWLYKLDKALFYTNKFIQQNKSYPFIYELLAQIYFKQKKYKLFLENYDEAIKLANFHNHDLDIMKIEYVSYILSVYEENHNEKLLDKAINIINSISNHEEGLQFMTLARCYKLKNNDLRYYYFLAKHYSYVGDSKKALHFIKLANSKITNKDDDDIKIRIKDFKSDLE